MPDVTEGERQSGFEDPSRAIFEIFHEAVIRIDDAGIIRTWNRAATILLGYTQEEMLGAAFEDFFPELNVSLSYYELSGINRINTPSEIAAEIKHKDGTKLDVLIKSSSDGSLGGLIIAARDASRSKRARAERNMLIECARLVGKPFLLETVRVLSIALAVRCVLLAEVDSEDTNIVRSVAFWADDKMQPDFAYELDGTACAEVVQGNIRFFRDNVQQQFPDDQKLKSFDAESYLGVPLHNRDGRLMGLLAVFHDQPMDERLEPILTIELFAGRASAEIERLRTASSTERLGRIVEDAASETFLFDAETLKFILVNRGARENLGYTMEELRDLTPIDIKPEITDTEFRKLIEPLKNGEESLLKFETVHRRGDGSDYDVSVKLQLLKDETRPVFYAAIEDVTERNATLNALQEVTRRLDTILNNTKMAVFLMNDQQQCLYMNEAAESLTGFKFGETEGRVLHDVIHHKYPDGRPFPLEECPIDRALPEDNQVQGEDIFVHKDGSFYPVAFTASPIRDISGKAIGTVIEAKNISDEIKARTALENFNAELSAQVDKALAERDEVEAQLRQSQKMDAVGKLTGGVAHDFNNLLQVIGGNLDLLERDVAGNPRAQKRLEMASAGVQRGARLAQQLLAFSRKQPLAPKVSNLARLVHGLDDMLRRTLGERIELETVVPGDLWNCFVDEAQLENAILNLAINARDAMEDAGTLTIEVANADVDEFYARQHPDMNAGHYLVVSVTDSGCGMTQDVLDRIFEPFFTTKEVGKGTGLGLSMVYGLVKQSGGHVNVYSEPGEGTTVKMYLPRSSTSEEPIIERPKAVVTGGDETILVVEDDDDVRTTVTGVLNELGYTVLVARDAASGLAIIESGAKLDLIFSDVIMPGKVQSREMAQRAQELLPNVAVLFTSGYTENSIVHDGRLDEGVELLSKPYGRDTLARKLRECLDAAHTKIETSSSEPAPTQVADVRPRILFVEDEVFIRLSGLDMLSELGYDAEGASTATAALKLLAEGKFDVLITDLGLPDIPGQELARIAEQDWPEMQIIIATGHDREHANLGGLAAERTLWLNKPFTMADIDAVLKSVFKK